MSKIRKRQGLDDPSDPNSNLESGKNLLANGEGHSDCHQLTDLKGDRGNIAILFFLYLLQGIPLGLSSAIPMLLQNRGVSYKQQAEFSFAHWPFSLKLLWAPIVDSMWSTRFGRRKSWMVPTQYLIGAFMLLLSGRVDGWLGSADHAPNIEVLTLMFFLLNFLAATQDIAVDGWALTMLKRCNVGHASTCNSVGQTAGFFLGYVAFMALESAEFCNSYLRYEPANNGIVTLPGFLWFWGIAFLISTTLVAIFKKEAAPRQVLDSRDAPEPDYSLHQAYSLLWDIMKLKPIKKIAVILLTAKIAFCACDAVTSLKLIDAGIPKDKLALLAVPMIPLQIALPLAIARYTVGPRPMDVYLRAIPLRLFFGVLAAGLVWLTPHILITGTGQVPYYYYGILLLSYSLHQIALYSMFVAVMAFFARVSDPAVGGTYMTLLNTLSNLGSNWPATLALAMVDMLTYRQCTAIDTNLCEGTDEQQQCLEGGGKCIVTLDGYYVESIFCLIFGLLWLKWSKRRIQELQSLDMRAWKVKRNSATR